jgi:hypothetical protein
MDSYRSLIGFSPSRTLLTIPKSELRTAWYLSGVRFVGLMLPAPPWMISRGLMLVPVGGADPEPVGQLLYSISSRKQWLTRGKKRYNGLWNKRSYSNNRTKRNQHKDSNDALAELDESREAFLGRILMIRLALIGAAYLIGICRHGPGSAPGVEPPEAVPIQWAVP